ncbi:MAG: leucine-rich repeat domain-containing protein, partial [Bacillota bacterium]
MHKPTYILLLLFFTIFTLGACSEDSDNYVYTSNETEDGYTFSLDGNVEHVHIPETHEGIPITHIDQSVFVRPSVKTIHIPKHVMTMDFRLNDFVERYYVDPDNKAYASMNGVLYTNGYELLIHYPHGLTDEHYEMSSRVRIVAGNAFRNHPHLVHLVLGENVNTIKAGAFSHMEKLTTVDFGFNSNVEVIEESAFAHSEKVTLASPRSSKLTHVGPYAFEGMSQLKTVIFHEDASLETLESGVFYLNKSLETLIFPDGLKTIEWLALSGINVTSLHINEALSHIANESFIGMQNLETITISENNSTYKVVDGILYDKTMKTLVHLPMQKEVDNLVIPASVDTVHYVSLRLNPYLESITFEGSMPPELIAKDITYP